jgi:hypothetical protein
MSLKNYKKVVANTPAETRILVRHSMNILDRIHELLDEKFGGKQKLLAEKLGKKEAEISKWLSGTQNFTLKTISKLESAFGESIIGIKTTCDHSTFMQVKVSTEMSVTKMMVANNGEIIEQNYTAAGLAKPKHAASGNKILS